MFYSYLWRELRRRARQAIFIAGGLALGIGLGITVTAASAGVKNAQSPALHPRYGVGTAIPVPKTPTAGAAGNGELGPLSTGTISSGRTFTAADNSKDVALVEASYATSQKLKVGSTIEVGNSKGTATKFTVVGIVSEPAGDSPSDVYLPLGVA